MNIFKGRPMAFICFEYLLSSVLLFVLTIELKIIVAVAAISTAVIIFLIKHKINVFIGSLIFIGLSAIISAVFFNIRIQKIIDYTGKEAQIEAVITDTSYKANFCTFQDIVILSIDGKKIKIKAKLECPFYMDAEKYEKISMKVIFTEFEEDILGFPEKSYNNSRGIYIKAQAADYDYEITGVYKKGLSYIFSKINDYCSLQLKKVIEKDSSALVEAVLLGNKDNIPKNVNRDFARLGISHLVAVSGMHFSILMGGLSGILKSMAVNKKLSNAILILTGIFYIGITGASPSVLRSGIMFILMNLALFTRRDSDSITSLFVSVTLITIFSPGAIFDAGLLLSFFATLGIVVIVPYVQRKLYEYKSTNPVIKSLKAFILALVTTLSAVVFTLPIIWIYFGKISIVSPITNLIFSPIFTLIMLIAPCAVVFSFIPFISSFFGMLCTHLGNGVLFLSKEIAKYKNITVSLKYPFIKWIIVIFFILLVVLLILRKESPLWIILPAGICIASFFICVLIYNSLISDNVNIAYINYKKSDGILISTDNKALYCDISDGSQGVSKRALYLNEEKFYYSELDGYLLTHYHQRNISTLYKLLQYYYIYNLFLPQVHTKKDQAFANELQNFAKRNDINVIFYNNDYDIEFGNVKIDVMEKQYINRSTHPVLALSVKAGDNSVLYLGSSYFDIERDFYDRYSNSDTLIIGIHGPVIRNKESLCESFGKIIYSNEDIYSMYNCTSNEKIILNDDLYYTVFSIE